MDLKKYYDKKVKITGHQHVLTGEVLDYMYPEDNEDGKESLIVRTEDGVLREYNEDGIRDIEILE